MKALAHRSSLLAACSAMLLSSAAGVMAQSVLSKATRTSESMEPALVHPGRCNGRQAEARRPAGEDR